MISKKSIRAGALAIAGLVAAWAVPYFAPGVAREVRDLTRNSPEIRVEVLTDFDLFRQNLGDFLPSGIVPASVHSIPPPPGGRITHHWLRKVGAVDAIMTPIEIVVRNDKDSPVLITGVELTIVDRQPPLTGKHLVEAVGGGPLGPLSLRADLDEGGGVPKYFVDKYGNPTEKAFPLKLEPEEFEVIDLYVFSLNCDCRWIATLSYVSKNGTSIAEIGNRNEPFRTSGISNAETYRWDGHAWVCGEGC